MSKINDLIEFLKLDRRFEEAEAKNQGVDYTKVTITTIDTNETSVVNRTEFENTNIYLRIVNQLDKYIPTDFYVLPLTDKSIYYIKIDDQIDGFNYLNLENNRCEKVDDEQLLQKIEIGFTTNQYFYDKNNREVVFSNEILEDVAVFGDRILFDPEKLDITTGTYSYSYSKPITTFCQFIDGIINIIKLFVTPFLYSGDKKKDLMVYVKQKGSIFLIPTISTIDDYFYATYYYTSSGKKMFYQINNPEDVAIQLEFKGKEPFLSFLNETIFTQENFNYLDDFENQRRIEFKSKFKQLIIAPLEKEMNSNSETAFYDAMVTLYYLTDTIALTLSNETLWKLFETGISRNSLTNKGSLEEENIYLKLLEAIANKETTKIAFLNRLLRKKGNTTTTYLEFLFNSIHGDNGTAFAKLVNKVWKQSRFVNSDSKQNKEFATTNGPIILPYKSEKCLGFYFSNAATAFENENIEVDFNTGKYIMVKRKEDGAMIEEPKEIIAHYNYHPFYPIYLKNVEKQETSLKLDAIVPAFMLLANQSQQFWHNVIKTGEYGLDALSIASGFGALAEFRYLRTISQLAVEAEEVSAATKITRAANILANVKGASGVIQITSGAVNTMLKITELDETEFGQKISKVLFFLELITLTAEITVPMKNGLKNVAKEAIEESDEAARLKNPELFEELYKIVGFDKLNRKILFIVNTEDIGKQGNKIIFKLVDHTEKEVGELIRGVGTKGRSTKYQLSIMGKKIDLNSEITLFNSQMGRSSNLPIDIGEEIIYADLNIPAEITSQYSGLGEIMLDESLAYFNNSVKFGNPDGNIGYWVKFEEYYKEYGGQSINLKQFWEAVDSGKSYEQAAQETFTGQWAEKNGFTKVVFRNKEKDIAKEAVIVKFLKNN